MREDQGWYGELPGLLRGEWSLVLSPELEARVGAGPTHRALAWEGLGGHVHHEVSQSMLGHEPQGALSVHEGR